MIDLLSYIIARMADLLSIISVIEIVVIFKFRPSLKNRPFVIDSIVCVIKVPAYLAGYPCALTSFFLVGIIVSEK